MKLGRMILIVLTMLSVSFCVGNNSSESADKLLRADEISNQHIEEYNFGVFVVKFSNIIFEKNGKDIKIPIFQGKYGNAKNEDVINYCIKQKYINEKIWLGYAIKCKRGEVKKTFHEFLDFYKSNILKDVDLKNPNAFYLSSGEWNILYDFNIDGIPCFLEIIFDERADDQKSKPVYKTVYDINPEENLKDPSFLYRFIIGVKSTD